MIEIWKYVLSEDVRNGRQECVPMPNGAKILTLQKQYGKPALWVLVNTDMPIRDRYIDSRFTGALLNVDLGPYIGTVQLNDGVVVHYFDNGYTPQ